MKLEMVLVRFGAKSGSHFLHLTHLLYLIYYALLSLVVKEANDEGTKCGLTVSVIFFLRLVQVEKILTVAGCSRLTPFLKSNEKEIKHFFSGQGASKISFDLVC